MSSNQGGYVTANQFGFQQGFVTANAPATAAFASIRADMPADSKLIGLTTPTENTAIATINGTRDGIVIEAIVELALTDGKWRITKQR